MGEIDPETEPKSETKSDTVRPNLKPNPLPNLSNHKSFAIYLQPYQHRHPVNCV